jgi:hypothetical protein
MGQAVSQRRSCAERTSRWRVRRPGRDDAEHRSSNTFPAVVANPPGEKSIENAGWRIRGDVPDAHTAAQADVSGDHDNLGTPSYVEASSA